MIDDTRLSWIKVDSVTNGCTGSPCFPVKIYFEVRGTRFGAEG
jgi:hypothetical protein